MPDGGGGGGNTTSTTVQELSPEQKKILGLATPIFQDYLRGGTSGLQGMVYPGQTVAPLSANEQFANSLLKSQATGELSNSASTSLKGLNFLTSGAALDPNSNPALRGTIDAAVRPLTEQFQRSIIPSIEGDAVLTGGYGSNRQEINTRLAAADYGRQVADTSSQIAYQGYNTGIDAMGRALAFAPGVMQGAQLPGQTISAIGAQERGMDQALIQDEMTRFYNERFMPLMIAQQIAGTAFGYPGGSTLAKTDGGATGPGPLQGAIGGAAIGTSLMPGWGTAGGAALGALLGMF